MPQLIGEEKVAEFLSFRCAVCGGELLLNQDMANACLKVHPCLNCTRRTERIYNRMKDFVFETEGRKD